MLWIAMSALDARAITQEEATRAVAAVLPSLEEIRGLKFVRPVPVTVIDDARARRHALERFRRMTPEAKIRADETTYRLLGLIPPDTDVLKTLLDVLEEQAGGFYDPQTKSFYLLDDMPKSMTRLLAAHEMTHALEDQSYDIDGRLEKLAADDDASFALSAVAEGSATLASAFYVASAGPDAAGDDDAAGVMQLGMERLNSMPSAMRRALIGPYVLGMSFLLRGGRQPSAGFPKEDVNAAWKKPPTSSEQILHPEKYWVGTKRDDPIRVTISAPTKVLGKGWALAGSGILGELMIAGLVGASGPDAGSLDPSTDAWTNAAAAGWGGDRFELWSRGDAHVVLLATVWDTERDAQEFERALPRDRPQTWIKRRGAKVGIVAGAAGAAAPALLDLLVKP
jgi:hypothetical protein